MFANLAKGTIETAIRDFPSFFRRPYPPPFLSLEDKWMPGYPNQLRQMVREDRRKYRTSPSFRFCGDCECTASHGADHWSAVALVQHPVVSPSRSGRRDFRGASLLALGALPHAPYAALQLEKS